MSLKIVSAKWPPFCLNLKEMQHNSPVKVAELGLNMAKASAPTWFQGPVVVYYDMYLGMSTMLIFVACHKMRQILLPYWKILLFLNPFNHMYWNIIKNTVQNKVFVAVW